MTTPPKVRRFHLTASESPVGSVRPEAPGAPQRPSIRVEVQRGARAEANTAAEAPAGASTPTSGAASGPARPEDMGSLFASTDDGFGSMRFPGADPKPDAPSSATPAAPPAAPTEKSEAQPAAADAPADASSDEAKLAAIRAENLTSRQLRMAARIAAAHAIEVASEYEAVLRLRERGIDPFHRGAVGRLLSTQGNAARYSPSPNAPVPVAKPGLPARTRRTEIAPIAPGGGHGLPSREELTEERRAAEIYRIQRDIAKRRRRNLAFLMMRLMLFVGLPTILAGWYYFQLATPLYATKSQFLIQSADSGMGAEGAGIFGGAQMMNQDSVSVQSYLSSREALLRLDEELGFARAFKDPTIDPLLRLPEKPTNEEVYSQYLNSVKIGYDPTEGVINMEVIVPDPKLSEDFSHALIRYAEGHVDEMTARLRGDQMKGAVESYEDAERKVQAAQTRVQQLQERLGVLDPTAEGSVVLSRIAELEGNLAQKKLELGQLKANPRPNQSRVEGVEGDISRIETMIAETRAQFTESQGSKASLASISGELRIAESDLETRQQLLANAAIQMETARIEANKQVRYLSLSVPPIPPDEATYPKSLQNTIVAFLIFSGIYLMMSLTASILREQVSS